MIENQQRFISNWETEVEHYYYINENKRAHQLEGAIRLAKARVQALEKEKETRLEQINEDAFADISEFIVSLNLITII